MKWCIILSGSKYPRAYFPKLAREILKNGDQCLLVLESKLLEYNEKGHFPKGVKFISKVDWCLENYKSDYEHFEGTTWKDFFATYDRRTRNAEFTFNYNNSKEIVSQLYQFFNQLFETEKPDIIIGEPPADICTQLAYRISRKRGLDYLGIMGSRFENRFDIYDLYYTCSLYKKIFNEITYFDIGKEEKEELRDFIQKFIIHAKRPVDIRTLANFSDRITFLNFFLNNIKRFLYIRIDYVKNYGKFKNCDWKSESILRGNLRTLLKPFIKKLRTFLSKNLYDKVDYSEDYFLYPLHFQPEATTSVLASYFSQQLATVENIAFALPFPYKLFVKEHPVAVGTRARNFYKKLKSIPNVVLISANEDIKKLIKNSKGVIVLTGTTGIEAAFMGKPVYALGKIFYDYHPLCKKVESIEELRQALITNDNEIISSKSLEEANIRFAYSYFENTIPGSIYVALSKNDSNDYELMYKRIKEIREKIHQERNSYETTR